MPGVGMWDAVLCGAVAEGAREALWSVVSDVQRLPLPCRLLGEGGGKRLLCPCTTVLRCPSL